MTEEVFATTTQRMHGHTCPGCSGWTCYDEECETDRHPYSSTYYLRRAWWSERECPDCEERDE